MEENTKENPFQFFDFDYDEATKIKNELIEKGRISRDSRVCTCGHPMSRHRTNVRGDIICKPSTMYCPCKHARPVVEVQDGRDFLHKTVGVGAYHALARGLQSCAERGHWVKWIVEIKCDKCGTVGQVSPTPVTQEGEVRDEATGWDALLCRACRTRV